MPRLDPEDFLLPAAPASARRRGNRVDRLSKEPGVDKAAIAKAADYLDEAAAGARELTDEVRKFATHAHALITGGLTFNAVVVLIIDLLPKPHGRPAYSAETVAAVLKAAARLDEHIRETKA